MVDNKNILDINSLLNGEVRKIEFNAEFELDSQLASFVRPATMGGKVVNMASYIEFSCKIEYSYLSACSRCLKALERNMQVELNFPVAVSLANQSTDADEYIIPQNGKIDLYRICYENFILNQPVRELCSEDCKGLCPGCGADLNVEKCTCKKQGDSRLQVLADFFKD